MQTKLTLFLALLATSVLLFGCEKVIDVELNDADPQTVIEANFSQGIQVKISETGDYFSPSDPVTITDAAVTLTGSDGTLELIPHTDNGVYSLPTLNAEHGVTYTLEVATSSGIFTASSTMPAYVPLDTLYPFFMQASPLTEEGFTVAIAFQDDDTQTDYYRILVTVNGVLRNNPEDYILTDDLLANGNWFEVPLVQRRYEPGDEVEVELRPLDPAVYDYFYTLSSVLGGNPGPQEAAPANPSSNWSNDALGYFSAHRGDSRTVVIP